MNFKLPAGLLAGLFLLSASLSASAFTTNDVNLMFNSYIGAFYSLGRTNAWFKHDQAGGVTYFWEQAEEIECVIDAYEWTSNATYRPMITNLLNGFLKRNGSSWAYNHYNDDIMWATLAFLRGGRDTGQTNYCNIARANFDACFARAWSTNLGGGLYWTYPTNTNKNAAVNGPAAIAASLLYQVYGDTNYWNDASNIYTWERSTLFNTTSGRLYGNIDTNGTINQAATTYNQGTFIGAANLLGRTNDAMLAANYAMNHMGSGGILPEYRIENNNSGFNAIFIRWMAKFMKARGLQNVYQRWLQTNAEAAWNVRRTSDNLSWCQWLEPTPLGTNLYSWDCIASVEAMEAVPPTEGAATGPPQIYTDVPAQLFVLQGQAISNSITVEGAEPLTYQWQFNGTNLLDGNGLTGSRTNVLMIANTQTSDAGNYRVIITNVYGSATSGVSMLVVGGNRINFYGAGLGWQNNGGATIVSNTLTLVDKSANNEARSSFFSVPQYIGAFRAAFTYQQSDGTANGGVAFILQNDSRGTSALGGYGGHMGVNGISPSLELELNGYPKAGHGVGYGVFTNGNNGFNTLSGDVNFWTSGDPVRISVDYAQGQMTLTFTDAVAQTFFRTNLDVGDLPAIVGGDTAYIGFSGSDGAVTALLTVSNFTFVSIPTETIVIGSTNAVISWPEAIDGYTLQQSPDLSTTQWVDVTNADNLVNGAHQVTVPAGAANVFYRLKLQ